MLWDLIRDFFVQHVFGGTLSDGTGVSTVFGHIVSYYNGVVDDTFLAGNGDILYKIYEDAEGYSGFIGVGDWLSTTATAISITIIVVLCCLFVYKIVRLIGGLIR